MPISEEFDPALLFYSYSRADALMRKEFDKHLATLKRSGLLKTWHDRDIESVQEWKNEIDEKLDHADIILLLLSPDFINSEYCYSIEGKRALDRHSRDEATVIPIVLRPVDLKGSPFSDLQMLPTNAFPVSSRPIDEALKEVADGVRLAVERIVERRLRSVPVSDRRSGLLHESRELDAAVDHEISIGEFRDVAVMVRRTQSDGLHGALLEDRTYSSSRPMFDHSISRQSFFYLAPTN